MEEQSAPSGEAPKPAPKGRGLWIGIAVVVVIVVILLALVLGGFLGPGAERAQAIFFPSYPGAGDLIIPAWWQNRATWPADWLYSEGLKVNDFFGRLRTAGVDVTTIEGTAPAAPLNPDYNASSALFNTAYQAAYGTTPNVFDPHSYDATFVLAMAFQKSQSLDTNSTAFKAALREVANPPGVAIRPGQWAEALENITNGADIDYQGASGSVNFDSFGEVSSDYEAYGVNANAQGFRKLFIPEGSWTSPPISTSALAVVGSAPEPLQATPLKIGTLFDRTGALQDFGWDMENATDLAASHVNTQGGITIGTTLYDIVLIHEDDGTDTTKTTNAATKLVNVDQVKAVVGATASSMSIAAFGITRPAGILQMSASSTSAALSPSTFDPTDQFWRTAPSDQLQGAAAAWYAFTQRGWRTMSITYVDNAYGRGLAAVFEQEFEARGGRILRSVPHSETPANIDANSVLQTLFTPGAQASVPLVLRDAWRVEGR
jgi:branched-chain amino acid transport system substrate-binding protein